MQFLFILNDPPYGTERTYNGLRLALNLQRTDGVDLSSLSVFLMADAVNTAKAGQQTPSGYYNLERMIKGILKSGGQVLLCGTCMDARGLKEAEMVKGTQKSTLDALTKLTAEADRILVF